jgi:hypothetical protein
VNKKHNIRKYEKRVSRPEQLIRKKRSSEDSKGTGLFSHFNRLR